MASRSGSKPHRLRRGEGSKRVDQLVDAADRLLQERGDARDITVADVVKAVGVTAPVLYRHFADKRALFGQVYRRRFADFRQVVQAAAAEGENAVAQLRLRGAAYVRYATAHPTYYRALFMASDSLVAEIFADEAAREASPFQDLLDNVRAGMVEGTFPAELDAIEAAKAIWSFVHGVTALAITVEGYDLGRPLDETLDLGLTALVFGLTASPR